MAHELKLALFGLHRGSSTDPERLAPWRREPAPHWHDERCPPGRG